MKEMLKRRLLAGAAGLIATLGIMIYTGNFQGAVHMMMNRLGLGGQATEQLMNNVDPKKFQQMGDIIQGLQKSVQGDEKEK